MAFSAACTHWSRGSLPASSKYTPTPRLTLLGLVSAANCSFRPRIGSRGAISTAENRDIAKVLGLGWWRAFPSWVTLSDSPDILLAPVALGSVPSRGALAPWRSSLDCFASLAMTG